MFLGLPPIHGRVLLSAVGLNSAGVLAAFAGLIVAAAFLLLAGTVVAVYALRLFELPPRPAKTKGVHASFPVFVRLAYAWALIAASLGIWAASVANAHGIWGASRHALTVGFLATMVFSVGQRILPAFSGMRLLFSTKLMFLSLLLLGTGCLLRVGAEILAYQGFASWAWSWLPVSAVIGNHEVRTAWGFLAVRLPLPEDKQWAADRATVLQALGVLDPDGKPTALVDTVKAADVARLTQEDWQRERDKMLKTCNQCHSENFAKQQLDAGDDMIRNADHLMAEAIRVVAGLYKDGVLPKPKNYAYAFPNLLTFHDAPTVIEQKLFVMYLEHRMRTFQGTFHASPDYAMWYGWSEMQRDLTEIRELADNMRRTRTAAATKPAGETEMKKP